MLFKPLRFVTGQGLHSFYSRLRQNKLIDTSTAITTQDTIKSLSSYFVRGVDGNFYILDDLKKSHPGVANNSTHEFFYASSSGHQPKRVTQEQLLAESLFCDLRVSNCIPLLVQLNPDLYNDSFPELKCSEDIESIAQSWCGAMVDFYSKLDDSDAKLWEMETWYLKQNKLPPDALPLDFINHFKIDILNITFFQQERLYTYLLTEKQQLKDSESARIVLNNWLQAIEENNQKLKKHLELYRYILDEYRWVYENHSQEILSNDIKRQQVNNFIFNALRVSISLAMIIGLHWYSLGSLTLLLLYLMFIEPIASDHPLIFIFVCLINTLQESFLVNLASIAIGFIIDFWATKSSEHGRQLDANILQCQRLEDYVASRSTWADLLSHLDIALRKVDNFLNAKQSLYSSDQEEPRLGNKEKVLASLEENNPTRPLLFKPSQVFSDITFFSNSQAADDSQFQEDAPQATISL